MEWTKQFEEMSKTWTETQQKMWENWAEMAKGASASQAQLSWETMLDTWQNAVQQTLDAQNEGVRMWTNGISSLPNTPQGTNEWASTFQDMTNRWNATQKQLWQNWFSMAHSFDPSKIAAGETSFDSAQMMDFWKETSQTMSKAQTDWMKMWGVPTSGVANGVTDSTPE